MATYRTGSNGGEVRQIQEKLKSMGIYLGPLDGLFGGGTAAAVRVYQDRMGLEADGVVGPVTWRALFGTDVPAGEIIFKTLDLRCLALTGSFETGAAFPECFAGVSGDFDGQGMSFGVCQWNFGQGSLPPLLKQMCVEYPERAREVFGEKLEQLRSVLSSSQREQVSFARSIQHPVRKTLYEPWLGIFKTLGRTAEFQRIEAAAAAGLYRAARALCGDYGVWSERAVALMFDIKVQNGSIPGKCREQVLDGFRRISPGLSDEERETARLRIIANLRAEAAGKRWVEDVRARKLCIANGQGAVHGIDYNLEEQFGIGLRRMPDV